MKVPIIQSFIPILIQKIRSQPKEYLAYSELKNNFDKYWDLDALDLSQMFDNIFKTHISKLIWKGDDWYPVEALQHFLKYDKELLRSIFKDLLNEKNDLNMRGARFVHHLDQLLRLHQNPRDGLLDHYHKDYSMIFLYLFLNYPETYAPYDKLNFDRFLLKAESKKRPTAPDPQHYKIITKAIKTVLFKNEEFLNEKSHWERKNQATNLPDNFWAYQLIQCSN